MRNKESSLLDHCPYLWTQSVSSCRLLQIVTTSLLFPQSKKHLVVIISPHMQGFVWWVRSCSYSMTLTLCKISMLTRMQRSPSTRSKGSLACLFFTTTSSQWRQTIHSIHLREKPYLRLSLKTKCKKWSTWSKKRLLSNLQSCKRKERKFK